MALDVKFELFIFEAFQNFFYKNEIIPIKQDIFQIYEEECHADPEFEEIINDERLYHAIACRYALFFEIYLEKVHEDESQYQQSMTDFLDYILRICNSDMFKNITVFERLFATCTFVMVLCLYCQNVSSVDFINYGHICWVIYFDKHVEEFHKRGGWIQLKEVAESYESLIEFIRMYRNILYEKNAVHNYIKFKQNTKFKDCGTISKSWVKFQNELLDTHYSTDAANGETSFHRPKTFKEIENFLQSLKKLCNPRVPSVFDLTGEQLLKLHEASRFVETDKVSSSSNESNIIFPTTKISAFRTKPTALESGILEISSADTCVKNCLTGRDGRTSSTLHSKDSQKNISLTKGKTSSSDCKGRNTKIKKFKNIKEDISNEERCIIDFFRTILVLGDKQGINYIHSTLFGTYEELNPKKCSKKKVNR